MSCVLSWEQPVLLCKPLRSDEQHSPRTGTNDIDCSPKYCTTVKKLIDLRLHLIVMNKLEQAVGSLVLMIGCKKANWLHLTRVHFHLALGKQAIGTLT